MHQKTIDKTFDLFFLLLLIFSIVLHFLCDIKPICSFIYILLHFFLYASLYLDT